MYLTLPSFTGELGAASSPSGRSSSGRASPGSWTSPSTPARPGTGSYLDMTNHDWVTALATYLVQVSTCAENPVLTRQFTE
jgi:hypothetical protein